jgi:hypothetical protein
VVASLDEKYNQLQHEVLHQKEKGKTSLVDNLLHGTASPFTDRIFAILLLEKFKVLSITTFIGIKDPIEHMDNYRAHMDLHGTPVEVAGRAFSLTLSGSAQDWFRKLPPNSIDSFDDLRRKFLVQFLVRRVRKKPSSNLMLLHQQDDESLKDFIIRFNQAKLSMESPKDEMV